MEREGARKNDSHTAARATAVIRRVDCREIAVFTVIGNVGKEEKGEEEKGVCRRKTGREEREGRHQCDLSTIDVIVSLPATTTERESRAEREGESLFENLLLLLLQENPMEALSFPFAAMTDNVALFRL